MASESEDQWRCSFSLILCQVFIKQRKYNFRPQRHLRYWHSAVGCPEEEKEPGTAPPAMIRYRSLGHASFYQACCLESQPSPKEGHCPAGLLIPLWKAAASDTVLSHPHNERWHLKEAEHRLFLKIFLLGCMNNFEIKIWGSGEIAQVDNVLAVQTQRPEIRPTVPMWKAGHAQWHIIVTPALEGVETGKWSIGLVRQGSQSETSGFFEKSCLKILRLRGMEEVILN